MIRTGKPSFGSLVSRSALGIALALGVAAGGMVTATPAHAAKKEKNKAGGFSKEFIAVAAPLQKEIDAMEEQRKAGNDVSGTAQALKPKVEAAAAVAQNGTDQAAAGQFMLTVGQATQDNAMNQRAIKTMIESGTLSPERLPQLQFFLGNFAYANKDYATAAAAMAAAHAGGFSHEALMPILVQSYADAGNPAQGLAIARQAFSAQAAAGQKVPLDALSRASLVAYKANDGAAAMEFSNLMATQYPTPTNWLNAAQMARRFSTLDPQATLDLYRLMDRTGALDTERKLSLQEYKEYVETANPIRLPGEVIRIIDKGMTSGKLQASDTWATQAKQTASGRLAGDKAGIRSDLASAKSSSNGKVTQALADAFLNYGEAAQAEELYGLALGKGGSEKDVALTRMGIAQLDQGKLDAAKETFSKVTGPRKVVADLFTAYIAQKQSGA